MNKSSIFFKNDEVLDENSPIDILSPFDYYYTFETGVDKKHIRKLVKNEIEEIIRRSIYKSPITSILGPTTKMDKPIGKIYTMGSNVGGKYE